VSKPRQSSSVSVPAPIGGLNAYDSLAAMPETDAVVMRNFYPQAYGVALRKGYQEFASGFSGIMGALMRHYAPNGTQTLFAADGAYIYNITAGGVVGVGQRVCPSANCYWQNVALANAVATYCIAFNGTDNGFLYSQAGGYMALTLGDGIVAGTWKNIDPKKLVQPLVHQRRLWAVEKNSTKAWYLPSDQVWGVATFFDFGGCFSQGGCLQSLATWTVDSGLGPNDYLAAFSSAGEVAVYQGTDPNSVTTWKLVGVFYVGATFSRKCWTKFGGDVAFLTQYGMLTLNSVLSPDSQHVLGNLLSQKIQRLISQVISASSSYAGWDILNFAEENMILINVPGLVPSQTVQLAYNSLTKAWTLFNGMPAEAWLATKSSLMFAGDERVFLAWQGYRDGVEQDGTGGNNIVAECQQAFSYFSLPGVTKHYKMVRPTFLHESVFNYRIGANMGFDFTTSPRPASNPRNDFGMWDASLWDSNAAWKGGTETSKLWSSVVGVSFAAAPRIAIDASSEVVWIATDWLMEKGGVI